MNARELILRKTQPRRKTPTAGSPVLRHLERLVANGLVSNRGRFNSLEEKQLG